MNLFDDAAAFMKNRSPEPSISKGREDLIQKLRHEFDNATRQEIEKALDRLEEKGELTTDFNEVLKKVRIWLED